MEAVISSDSGEVTQEITVQVPPPWTKPTRHMDPDEARQRRPELRDLPLMTASDAHYLDDIGRHATCVSQELALADVGALEWGRLLAAELTAGAN